MNNVFTSFPYRTVAQHTASAPLYIRFLSLFLFLIIGIGNAWGYWYVPGDFSTWNLDEGSQMNGSNEVTYYAVPAGTYEFKLNKGGGGDWGHGSLTNGTTSIITTLCSNCSNSNNKIVTNQTADLTFRITNEGSWACTVTASAPTYHLKYNWGNSGWSWKTLVANGDGTYSCSGLYRGSNSGDVYNYKKRTSVNDSWCSTGTASDVTLVNSPSSTSDNCIFTYNPSTDKLTIRKCNTATKTHCIYFDNGDADWADSYIYFVIGRPEYSKMYQLTQISNTKLWYISQSSDDWTDCGYYAVAGGSSAWDGGTGWGPLALSGWNHYSAPFFTTWNLINDKSYLVTPASSDNGSAISFETKSDYKKLNSCTQTVQYALSTDGGSTYTNMTSGNTPGALSFSEWYKFSANGTVASQSAASLSANKTTYSKKASSAAYRGKVVLTESSTQTGYDFIGWYEGSTEKSTSTSYTYYPAAATTITARFKAHRYTITYDANDTNYPGTATGSTSNSSHVYGVVNALTSNGFSRTGYSFAGWNTEADGTGDFYTDGESISNLTATDNATITLYAMWGRQFSVVTSSMTLQDKDELIIVDSDVTKALSTTQQSGNRASVGVTVSEGKVIVPDLGSIQIITLEADGDYFWFNVGTGYLYASSNSSDQLKTAAKGTAGNNGKWDISIASETNIATITAQGDKSHNLLQNKSNVFSCYTEGQTAIKLYYCSSPYIRTASDLSTFTYAVGYGPSLAQAIEVRGYNLTGNLTVTAPSNYEVCASLNGTYSSSIILSKDGANKVNTTIYVRLASGKSANDYDGTLTISGGGSATADVSLTGTVSAAPSGTAYRLVIDEADLFPSDEIVIMNADGSRLLSNKGTNNRTAARAADNYSIAWPTVFTKGESDSIQTIVLEGCDDEWLFKVGDDSYLYASSSSNNYLATNKLATAGNNGKWKIRIDGNYNDTIIAQGTSTHNWLWYYTKTTTDIFSCYANAQTQLPKIYAKPSATANVCGYPSSLSGLESTYGSSGTPQPFSVKARNISTGNVTVSAPTGYEVCLTENGTYTSSVTITPVSNSVEPTTVFVRLKDNNNAGSVDGNISISATGATTRTIALTGTVNKADPAFVIDSSIELTLRGSSVVKEELFISESDGTCTLTFDTSGGGNDEEGVTFDQEANTLTFDRTGTWDITINQAATTNYNATSANFLVEVTCGTPYTPENLSVDDVLSRTATLSWDPVDGADHYILYVTDGTSDIVNNEEISGTSYELEGLTSGTTYYWSLDVVNSCDAQLTAAVDGEEFTTLYAVTYHAASELKDSIIYDLESGDNLEDTYIPSNCAIDRVFIGWSELEIALSDNIQTEDGIAEFIVSEDGTLEDVTGNKDLYAIYASRNGSDGHDYVDNFNGYTTSSSYSGKPKIFGIWTVTWGNTSDISDVITKMGSNAIVLQKGSETTAMTTTKKIHNFTGLTCKIATTENSVEFVIEYSTNGNSWTPLQNETTHPSVRTAIPYTCTIAGDPVDAYVRFRIHSAGGTGNSYRMYIDDVTLYSKPHSWILTDYTTACTKPASVTVSFEKHGGAGDVPTAPATGGSITLPALTKAGYMLDGYTVQADGQDEADGIYYVGESFLVNHSVTFDAQWTKYFESIDNVSPITSGKDIAVRSVVGDSIVINSDDCSTPTASITGTDKDLFAVTIDDTHKRRAGGKTHYPFYVTYTPAAHNAIHEAEITFTCDGIESSAITVRGRSLPEEFVIAGKFSDDGKWYALPNNIATSSGTVPVPIEVYVDNNSTPTKALVAKENLVYKTADRYEPNPNTQFVSLRLTPDGTKYLRAREGDNCMWLSSDKYSVNTNWYLASSDLASYLLTLDPANAINKRIGFKKPSGIKMGFYADPDKGSDIYFLPIEAKADYIDATVTSWAQSHIEVTLAAELDVDAVTAKLGATSDDATEITGSGTQYGITFDDLDLSGKSGEKLVLVWKKSSSTVGASIVTIPSIVAPSAEVSDWSDISATEDDIVVIKSDVTVDATDAVAKSVVLTDNHKLTIGANKALVVTGKITREDGSPTTAADLVIKSTSAGNGTLIFENGGNEATVEMYSIASTAGAKWTWQYIAVPVSGASVLTNYYDGYLYKWAWSDSKSKYDWISQGVSAATETFAGYCVSYPTAGHTFVIEGALATETSKDISVPAGKEMVVGNSWTAPIQIKQMTTADFLKLEATVYLFNTGSDESGTGSSSGTRYEAGTYRVIPINASAATGDSVISALQGFYVKQDATNYSGQEGTLKLSYSKHVRPAAGNSVVNGAMHAPKLTDTEAQPKVLKLWACGSRYDDQLILLEREDFSTDFDNGWDGKKLDEQGAQPMLYTTRPDGTPDAVSALPELDGTVINFRAGEDNTYTLRFEYAEDNDELYIVDTQTTPMQTTRVLSGNTYTFNTSNNDTPARFLLTRSNAPQITTGNANANANAEKALKLILNQQLYIYRNGILFDATGRRVDNFSVGSGFDANANANANANAEQEKGGAE